MCFCVCVCVCVRVCVRACVRVCVCVECSSPAGMIEGTPQLHANAWKVSSACVAPLNQPVIDPCEMNQHNGESSSYWPLNAAEPAV